MWTPEGRRWWLPKGAFRPCLPRGYRDLVRGEVERQVERFGVRNLVETGVQVFDTLDLVAEEGGGWVTEQDVRIVAEAIAVVSPRKE